MELYHPCLSHFAHEWANFISLWRERGGGGGVDMSAGLGRAAKYHAVLLLCGLLPMRMFQINPQGMNECVRAFSFNCENHTSL